MDFEKLKATWQQLEVQSKEEVSFVRQKIRLAIGRKYRVKLNRILFPKVIFTFACFYFVFLFVLFFDSFDTLLLKTTSLFAILFLLTLPMLSFYYLFKMYRLDQPGSLPTEMIKNFTKQKIRFQKLQKINLGLGFVLIIAIIVLSTKIYNEYDVTESQYFWMITCGGSFLFVMIFYKWINKKYNRSIAEAEYLLKELQDETNQ